MSRFAIEWAKRQSGSDPLVRIVLIVLGDQARGRDHEDEISVEDAAEGAGIGPERLKQVLARIVAAGLAETRFFLGRANREWLAFRLLIPPQWRTPHTFARGPKGSAIGDRPTAVYRLYDADGKLLYVGISDNPPERFKQHEAKQPWWRRVVTRDVEWYEGQRLADAEEDRAIATERPLYNKHDKRSAINPVEAWGKRRYVVTGSRFAKYEATFASLGSAIRSGEYRSGSLPSAEALAEIYGVDAVLMEQVLDTLHRSGMLMYSAGFNWDDGGAC